MNIQPIFETKLITFGAIFVFLMIVQNILMALQKRVHRRLITHVEDGLYLFTSQTCSFCRFMKALYARHIAASQVKEVDVVRQAQLASRLRVTTVPTVLVVAGGKVAQAYYGITKPDALKPWLES